MKLCLTDLIPLPYDENSQFNRCLGIYEMHYTDLSGYDLCEHRPKLEFGIKPPSGLEDFLLHIFSI